MEFDMEQGTYTDHRNMVEYLVSGSKVFVRMRNRDNTWTKYEEALHGIIQLEQHVNSGYLTKRK